MTNETQKIDHVLASVRSTFDAGDPTPKYHQLRQSLAALITSGELKPADRFPTAQVLAEELGVTRVTVDRAINELAREGLCERVQGRGTFVSGSAPRITASDVVALVMPSHDHVWEGLVQGVLSGLRDHRHYCMVVDFTPPGDVPAPPALAAKLKRLVESQPAHLVVRGVSRFPFDLLPDFTGHLVFADVFESRQSIRAHYVLSDYVEGGRMLGRHLRGLGHERAVCAVSGEIHPWNLNNLAVLEGLRAEFGSEEAVCVVNTEGNDRGLRDMLGRVDRPRAIACLGDSIACRVYDAARTLELRIPEDLSVTGYYDTPWCHRLSPALTSVSIHEEKIAEGIVDAIQNTSKSGRIMVAPSLVVRESTSVAPSSKPGGRRPRPELKSSQVANRG